MAHGVPDSDLNVENLRQYLGEPIPLGGDESDTLFTDAQLEQLILDTGDWEHALNQGWAQKAASYAGLVDTAEGTSKRSLSDLHRHALDMVNLYAPGGGSGPPSQAVIHPIIRR
jgi:hypothetical protein